jgi:predicted CXXCH cytochrome family protein
MATHPVAEEVDPSEPTRPMTCISCHDPHAGKGSPRRFVTATKSSSPLCVRCHG